MESIEAKEQALVQHFKTAGLRQQKELALVNEILEIRKERRQLFSNLSETSSKLLASNNELTQTISILKEQAIQDMAELEDRYQKEIEAQKSSFLHKERVLQEELALRRENQKLHVQQEVNRVKLVYENKLQLVESKLKRQVAEKITKEIEDKYKLKMAKLHSTMESISQRDQQRELEVHRLESELAQMARENSRLTEENASLRQQEHALQRELEEARGQLGALEQRSHEQHGFLAELKEKHAEQLRDVDNKVLGGGV
eukprot:gene24321-29401_t